MAVMDTYVGKAKAALLLANATGAQWEPVVNRLPFVAKPRTSQEDVGGREWSYLPFHR